MKNLKFWSACFIVLMCASAAFSQFKFKGEVIQIVDGKTVVIDMGQGKNLTAELQGVEVPEPEQQLHQTVKDHLKNLLIGRQVEFNAREMTLLKTKGQLVSDGVDISQQLLRDGAAWYAGGADKSGYEAAYKNAEAQARAEQRGVWSIKNLKPAWEFRQEKAALLLKQKQEEEARLKAAEEQNTKVVYSVTGDSKKISAKESVASASVESWSTNPFFKNNGIDLVYKYEADKSGGYVSTPMMEFDVYDGKKSHRVALNIAYEFSGAKVPKGGQTFGVAIGDLEPEKDFLRENNVFVFVGKTKKLDFGKAEIKQTKYSQMIVYKTSRQMLEQLAAANNATVQIGKYNRRLDKSVLQLVKKILDATK